MTVPAWVRCPRCHHELTSSRAAWSCPACATTYPLIAGLPDLRIAADPWLPIEADRAKGRRLLEEAPLSFAGAVRHYWQLTPSTPAHQAVRHLGHVVTAEQRDREWLQWLAPPPRAGERWLDVGCGTADLAAAAPAGVEVVGLDVAFRWLCVASRRFLDAGAMPVLLCGNGEALPVADRHFDRVFFLGTVEHTPELARVLSEAARVLRPGGWVHIRAVNRLSPLPEPHVGLWGIGLLPRFLADRYCRWRGRSGYLHHWPRTRDELLRALRGAGFRSVEVVGAHVTPSEIRRRPRLLRWGAIGYARLRRWPLVRVIAPLLEAQGQRP
jgi:ubiquinone/menaquinone biosynthesis C-methylase UbiE